MKNTMRFTAAVVFENIVTVAVSLIYSSITGAISRSSLAAAGVCNQAISLIITLMNVMICGATILTAHEIGRDDRESASRINENALLCTPILSLAIMGILLITTPFIMRLLMPGAEADFLAEGTLYFRMMLYSLPFLALSSVLGSSIRASGDSKSPMLATMISCGVQLVTVWLFATKLDMGLMGAALATICCRVASAAYLLYVLLFKNRAFTVRLSRVLRPDFSIIRRMCATGLPNTFDGLAVQIGYVSINSMLVSMGTVEAGVVNVLNAVLLFTGICQGIGTAVTTTLIGQNVGAGRIEAARRSAMRVLWICEAVSIIGLSLPVMLFPRVAAGLFTKDPEILEASASLMWVLTLHVFVAVGCNVTEPSCRAAGDVRFVMTEIMCCVLLVRLPLTYLACFILKWGVPGVYAANIFSLIIRFSLAFFRIRSPKFAKQKI